MYANGSDGMKASELIRALRECIEQCGDKPVCMSGNEFPSGVTSVKYCAKGQPGYIAPRLIVLD